MYKLKTNILTPLLKNHWETFFFFKRNPLLYVLVLRYRHHVSLSVCDSYCIIANIKTENSKKKTL